MLIEAFYTSVANQIANTGITYSFGTSRGLSGDYITIKDIRNFDDEVFFEAEDCYYTKITTEFRIHSDTSQEKVMEMLNTVQSAIDSEPVITGGRYINKTLDSTKIVIETTK